MTQDTDAHEDSGMGGVEMPQRRALMASLLGGLALPLLPNAPWSDDALRTPWRSASRGQSCDDDRVLPVTDPANVIKAFISVGIAEVPVVGGVFAAIFDLLWPENGQSVWDQIKDKVSSLVQGAVEEEMLRRLNAVVNGMERVAGDHLKRIQQYQESRSSLTQGRLVASIDTTNKMFLEKIDLFANDARLSLRARCQILPLYAQLANFHLVLLRDAAVFARDYGFDEHGAAVLLEDFNEALEQHKAHVDATLHVLYGELRAEYEANRGKVRHDASNSFADSGWSATGAWESKKIENNTRSLLVAFVEDYRQLWPGMAPGAARPPALTRELWFGPYGVPDCRDLGNLPRQKLDERGKWNGEWVFDRNPEVVMPPSNPGRSIRYLGVPQIDIRRTASAHWRFPRNFEVYREGDGLTPTQKHFGISLAPQHGGPVIGVRVDTALYISRPPTRDCATGFLVSGVYFKQRDGRVSSVGSSGAVAREIKNYSGEDVPVPDGHVLHEIHQCSTVRKLYKNLGKDAPANTESVGSVMFSFKLADPALHLQDELLRRLFISSPKALSAGEVVDFEHRMGSGKGKSLSAAQRARLRADVEQEIKDEHWLEDRKAFWRRLDESGSR